jgi:hypothetical protein
MPVILATQEAENRRIQVLSQSCANSSQDPNLKKNPSQERASGVTQGVNPEFKPQYCKKKKEKPDTSGSLIPAILATEIRRMAVQGQSGQIVP